MPGTPIGIWTGPDGFLWVAKNGANNIGRLNPTTCDKSNADGNTPYPAPFHITRGPDNNMWFTMIDGDAIGRVTGTKPYVMTGFPLAAGSQPLDIKVGPDGNLWFTENGGNKIGKITTSGVITEYAIPTPNSAPGDINVLDNNSLVFTETEGNRLAKITTSGVITEFPVLPVAGSRPDSVVKDGGSLWFTEHDINKIGNADLSGNFIADYPVPQGFGPGRIIQGPPQDPKPYFTVEFQDRSLLPGNHIGRINFQGVITEYTIPTTFARPPDLTVGPDNNIWFTEAAANQVGELQVT